MVDILLSILGIALMPSLFFFIQYLEKSNEEREKTTQKLKKKINNEVNSLTGFTVTQVTLGDFIMSEPISGIAFDENRKKLCLITLGDDGIDLKIISYRDILSSEIFINGESVTKTDRSSQLGGALIGGLVFGGAGAIIGGLSGDTTTSTNIKDAILRLVINRTSNPIHDVNFLHGDLYTGEKDTANRHNNGMQEIRHWQGLMEIFIKLADLEDNKIDNNKKEVSVADEVKKLAVLRNEGILSEEEFLSEKTKLLN